VVLLLNCCLARTRPTSLAGGGIVRRATCSLGLSGRDLGAVFTRLIIWNDVGLEYNNGRVQYASSCCELSQVMHFTLMVYKNLRGLM
jgi:hypothetical protein